MLGEQTKNLFILWGTAIPNPLKSIGTMESYVSSINNRLPGLVSLVVNDRILPPENLREVATEVAAVAGRVAGRDARSALGSFATFVSWLENNQGSYAQLEIDLRTASRYTFLESYEELFSRFRINQMELLDYALSPEVSYFASSDAAMASWETLSDALLNNGQLVIRREYPLFKEFYRFAFKNDHIIGDKDGNTAPILALANATGHTTRPTSPDQVVLRNYMLSHIYSRSLNPLMFSGVYNFAFTPTFVDPFTEDASGDFAIQFRRRFRSLAHERFGEVYVRFKDFVIQNEVLQKIDAFDPQGYPERSVATFRRLARENWNPFFEIP